MEKLIKLGLPLSILAFIHNLVFPRRVICRFDEIDETWCAFRGLSQGSVLLYSPLLYNIYVSDLLLERCCPLSFRLIQYANKIAILSKDSNLDRNRLDLEVSLKKIKNKLSGLGLSLSLEKTKFCIFNLCFHPRLGSNRFIRIENAEVKASNQVRFLGLNFFSRLDWNSDINYNI